MKSETNRGGGKLNGKQVSLADTKTCFGSTLSAAILLAPMTFLSLACPDAASGPSQPIQNTFKLPTNQTVTPVGQMHQMLSEWPKDLALSPNGKILAVLTQNYLFFLGRDGAELARVPIGAGPLGIAWMPDSRTVFASGYNGEVYRIITTGKTWQVVNPFFVSLQRENRPAPRRNDQSRLKLHIYPTITAEGPPVDTTEHIRHEDNPQVTGLAISPDGRRLYAALGMANAVAVVDVATEKLVATVPVGIAPYRMTLTPDGKTLIVANRGGRTPGGGEPHSRTAGSLVRIDPMTGAAFRGSISFIDVNNFAVSEIEAGRQPSAVTVSPDGRNLYVANSDEDTVDWIDLRTHHVERTVSLTPPADPGFGQMPTDLARASDGKLLYITCGGGNSIAVISLTDFAIVGYIPAGWFPIAIAERDDDLFVANIKGVGTQAKNAENAFGLGLQIGNIQLVRPIDRRDLKALTNLVALNNHWGMKELAARPNASPLPVPERVGEPSVFRHVVYIIKENHTYDIDLGDMASGDGDKSLCLFGQAITPNEHALARQFVLLDRTFTSGINSADGHEWTDAAVANAYLEQNVGYSARGYSFSGEDPLARSPAGYIWNAALKAGHRVRVYGEFVNRPRIIDPVTGRTPNWKELWQDYQTGSHKYHITADTDDAVLNAHLHPNYIGFPLLVTDQWRADQFLAEMKEFDKFDSLPDLSILLLPCDHTAGAKPDIPTPRAMVADNDLALGRIVEGISHSRFWKDTLILVIEDDAQFGLDHVDGRRTVAFCISAYTKRGAVVNEPFNHTSFVRTIELVLGLPAMNRFDRTATPLTACFTNTPDLRPYVYVPNNIRLDEMNPSLEKLHGQRLSLGKSSNNLDLSQPDRADPKILALAAWNQQRPEQPFPWRQFKPNRNPDGDEDD